MRASFLIVGALTLLAACSTTPENRYYTLSVEPAAISTAQSPHAGRITIAKVLLPGVIDREQMVVVTGPQTVDIREFDRWAEPLDQFVPRTLAQDLALRVGGPTSNLPERRLFVSIDRFSVDAMGSSQLTGRWWMLEPGETAAQRRERPFVLSRPAEARDGVQVAAAMSALLGMLADDVARK
ncbi:MAG TPA: PqiC family protein [Aliidongia sp.]|nr:PqiC family protein [Aliidongia sp.]